MRAGVTHSFTHPPRYGTFADPTPHGDEVLVRVSAAALSQLTRGQANGKHYSSEASFPFVPGFDGVGTLADGKRVYFAGPAKPYGAMAERVTVRPGQYVAIPDELDDVQAAAIANPGMSSWAALTARAHFVAGESVLINGATGASGRLAIQIAKHLGAKTVIATGRTASSVAPLVDLGADVVIGLDQPDETLRDVFRHTIRMHAVEVVLDYLWGPSAEHLLAALVGPARVRFVQIGSLGGPTITMPSAVLRSSGVELLGSGLGSLSFERLIGTIGGLLAAVVPAKLQIATEVAPLADIEAAWERETGNRRLVLTM